MSESDEIQTGRAQFVGRLKAAKLKRSSERETVFHAIGAIVNDASHLAAGLDGERYIRAENIILECSRLEGFLEELGQ